MQIEKAGHFPPLLKQKKDEFVVRLHMRRIARDPIHSIELARINSFIQNR